MRLYIDVIRSEEVNGKLQPPYILIDVLHDGHSDSDRIELTYLFAVWEEYQKRLKDNG